MRLDDHFEPHEMFLSGLVVLLAVIRLCGDIDWTWWAITAPVWGYLVLIGLFVRLQEYLS